MTTSMSMSMSIFTTMPMTMPMTMPTTSHALRTVHPQHPSHTLHSMARIRHWLVQVLGCVSPRRCTALALLVVTVLLGACSTTPTERFYTLTPVAGSASTMPSAANTANAANATNAQGRQTTPSAASSTSAQTVLLIAPLSLHSTIDRTQWVVKRETNEVQVLEQQRWTQPLSEELEQGLSAQLRAQFAAPLATNTATSAAPLWVLHERGADQALLRHNTGTAMRLALQVLRFDTVIPTQATPYVEDEFFWSLRCVATGENRVASNAQTQRAGVFHSGTLGSASMGAASNPANPYPALAAAHTLALQGMAQEIAAAARALQPQCAAH